MITFEDVVAEKDDNDTEQIAIVPYVWGLIS